MDLLPPSAAQMPNTALQQIELLLEAARSGKMDLAVLMDRANVLQSAGLGEAAALLYQNWIAAPPSPFRHVACFNWGTLLGTMKRHAEAEAGYRVALSMAPKFAQARLNLGHQLEHL